MVGRRSIWCSVPTGSRLKMIKILRRFQSSGLPIEQSQVKMLNKTSWVLRWRMQSFATGRLDRHQCRIFFFFFFAHCQDVSKHPLRVSEEHYLHFLQQFSMFWHPFSPPSWLARVWVVLTGSLMNTKCAETGTASRLYTDIKVYYNLLYLQL